VAEERVQRRLAAILAADVVGYSRMMGEDEEGTLARLNTLRSELLHPKVSEYGGRIVKTTGDGTLIEFPSAVDAVQHAIDIQQALSHRNADLPEKERIEIRMGINLGDIIVQGEDIFGDGVNVAARLEGLAEPGGVYISDLVQASIRNKLDIALDDLGEQSLKNITEPRQAGMPLLQMRCSAAPLSRCSRSRTFRGTWSKSISATA
jgi:adenylate cyclase